MSFPSTSFFEELICEALDPTAVEERFTELEALDAEELAAELYEQKGWVAANRP
jgi:hypothetical protein